MPSLASAASSWLTDDFFTRFGECVRLSIHPQHDPTSKKFYINLLPGVEGGGTPWFHVVEEEEASMRLVKRLASKSVGKPEVIAL